MKHTKKVFALFFVFFALCMFASCKEDIEKEILKIEVDTTKIVGEMTLNDFDLSDIELIITYSDQTTIRIALTENMLSSVDLYLIQTAGTHTVTVNYLGNSTTFTITLVAEIGVITLPEIEMLDNLTFVFHSTGAHIDSFVGVLHIETLLDHESIKISSLLDNHNEIYYTFNEGGKQRFFNPHPSFSCWVRDDGPQDVLDFHQLIRMLMDEANLFIPASMDLSWFNYDEGWYHLNDLFLSDFISQLNDKNGFVIDIVTYQFRLLETGFEIETTYNFKNTLAQASFIYKNIGTTDAKVDAFELCGSPFLLDFNYFGKNLLIRDFYSTTIENVIIPSRNEAYYLIPISVIDQRAFYGLSVIKEVEIPVTIKYINDEAFKNAIHLSKVILESHTPPILGDNVFSNNAADFKIYVPQDALSTYKQAPKWIDYAHLIFAGETTIQTPFYITYQINDLPPSDLIPHVYNTPIIEPEDPFKEGYTFLYWEDQSNPGISFDFGVMPSENLVLKAVFQINQYDISFETYVDMGLPTLQLSYMDEIDLPNIEQEGYLFLGWYEDPLFSKPFDLQHMPNYHITLYALWEINTYHMYYHANTNPAIDMISTGPYHAMAISVDGSVFGWGYNSNNVLGLGEGQLVTSPQEISHIFNLYDYEGIYRISLGLYHSMVLTNYGNLYAWGRNSEGQLGTDAYFNVDQPINIKDYFDLMPHEYIVNIATGDTHTMVLTNLNRVFTVGGNSHGQLGDSTFENRKTPVDITSQLGLTQDYAAYIYADLNSSFIITAQGRVFAFGRINDDDIVSREASKVNVPTEIDFSHLLAPNEMVVEIQNGVRSFIAYTSFGNIFAWGDNTYGQFAESSRIPSNTPINIMPNLMLNPGETINSVVFGNTHILAITTHHRLILWGMISNDFPLGDATYNIIDQPIFINEYFNLDPNEEIVGVHTGAFHAVIFTSDRRLFCMGDNAIGQCGNDHFSAPIAPEDITPNFESLKVVKHQEFNYQDVIDVFNYERPYYDFLGWYTDKAYTNPFDLNEMPANDLNLYAKHERSTYQLIIVGMDGVILDQTSYFYKSDLSNHVLPIPVEVQHYNFIGYDELPAKMPAEDYYIYAHYELKTYQVIFLDDINGNIIKQDYVTHNDSATPPLDPIKPSTLYTMYTFDGWNQSFDQIISYTVIYATWLESTIYYQVNFDTDGGNEIDALLLPYEGLINPPDDPYKEGYNFISWDVEIPTHMPSYDLYFKAIWEAIIYDITFDTDGGSHLDSISIACGNQIPSIIEPTKEGYTFVSWHISIPSQMPAHDLHLVALWQINSYDLIFAEAEVDTYPADIELFLDEVIIELSLGMNHSAIVTSLGRVFIWGLNVYGQLGDGTASLRNKPVEITHRFDLIGDEKVVGITLGYDHSVSLTSNGRMFVWGANNHGQLGKEEYIPFSKPYDITPFLNLDIDETIMSIDSNAYQSSAVTSKGRLFIWGYNYFGQIGHSLSATQRTPFDVTPHFNLGQNEKIILSKIGHDHSTALTSAGRMFTWGNNANGLLGDATYNNSSTPIDITDRFDLAPEEFLVSISLGRGHVAVLTSNHRFFMWGHNSSYQLADQTNINRNAPIDMTEHLNLFSSEQVVSISLGAFHSSIVTSFDRVLMWGENNHGQVGNSTTILQKTPLDMTQHIALKDGEKVSDTNLGFYHSGLLTTYGRLFMWGYNSNSQLGDGSTSQKITPSSQPSLMIPKTITKHSYVYQTQTNDEHIEKDGYQFLGWFIDPIGQQPYEFTLMPAQNITVYAQWALETYDISYELDDGINHQLNPYTYDITTQDISLMIPTKEGHTFMGWYLDDTFNHPISNIFYGSFGHMTLYALWQINSYDVIYSQIDDYDHMNDILLLPNETLSIIKFGYHHSGLLTSMGRVFMWGANEHGQLGNQTNTGSDKVIEITSQFDLYEDEYIIDIALGSVFSMALTSSNRLFTWGYNYEGSLGNGDNGNQNKPIDITSFFNFMPNEIISIISAGEQQAGVITSMNRVFMWGRNYDGELGDGSFENQNKPKDMTHQFQFDLDEKAIQLSLHISMHSALLTSKGRVFTWGLNSYGQLGNGTTQKSHTPIDITNQFMLNENDFIISIRLGHSYSSAISHAQNVFMWGDNRFSQLGIGNQNMQSIPLNMTQHLNLNPSETIVGMHLAYRHTLVQTSEDRILVWGSNGVGELGDLTYTDKTTPKDITSNIGLMPNETISYIALGAEFSGLITSQQNLFMWGYNNFGQLGTDHFNMTSQPTQTQTFAMPSIVHVETYTYLDIITPYSKDKEGYNFEGWFLDPLYLEELTEFQMPSQTLILYGLWMLDVHTITYHLDGGINHPNNPNVFSKEDEMIILNHPYKDAFDFLGWYSNPQFDGDPITYIDPNNLEHFILYAKWEEIIYTLDYVYLDDYDELLHFVLNSGETVIQIEAGSDFVILLTSTGRVFTWGRGYAGQIGNNQTENQLRPLDVTEYFDLSDGEKIVLISAGDSHAGMLTSHHRVFMWGANFYGQIGNNTVIHQLTPIDITDYFSLDQEEIITHVTLGGHFSSATTSSQRLFMWGYNWAGQLGDGTTNNRLLPIEMSNNLNLLNQEQIVMISLGETHVVLLTSNQRVLTWGLNSSGQLGDGSNIAISTIIDITNQFILEPDDNIKKIASGNDFNFLLTEKGEVFAWGSNIFGKLGDGTTTHRFSPVSITHQFPLGSNDFIKDINTGHLHSYALSNEHRLYMWGDNMYGQLGVGHTTFRSSPNEITQRFGLDVNQNIESIFLGRLFSLALTSDQLIFMWGGNNFGQFGDGYLIGTNTPVIKHQLKHLTLINQVNYNFEELITEFLPERTGYTFLGWYKDITYQFENDFIYMPSQDITLYAKWQKNVD